MVKSNENPLLGKATSQESKEQESNPYNQKKDYLDYDKLDKAKQSSFADAQRNLRRRLSPQRPFRGERAWHAGGHAAGRHVPL